MITLGFGRWSSASGRWFIRRRLYFGRYRWTPFCTLEWRYLGKPSRNDPGTVKK